MNHRVTIHPFPTNCSSYTHRELKRKYVILVHVNREIVNECLCLHVRCWTCINILTPHMVTCRDMGGGGGQRDGGALSPCTHTTPPPSSSPSRQLFDFAAWGSHYKKNFSYSSKHAVRVIYYCSESLLFKAFIFLHMLLFTWLFEQLMGSKESSL